MITVNKLANCLLQGLPNQIGTTHARKIRLFEVKKGCRPPVYKQNACFFHISTICIIYSYFYNTVLPLYNKTFPSNSFSLSSKCSALRFVVFINVKINNILNKIK